VSSVSGVGGGSFTTGEHGNVAYPDFHPVENVVSFRQACVN
jgi:hypothetical protein